MNDPCEASATEVRQHFAEHLDRVLAGESFTIRRNGRVAAVLGPAVEVRSATEEVEER